MSNSEWHRDQVVGERAQRAHDDEQKRIRAENERMRDVLEEILKNCEGVLRGGLPHFSKCELASTVAYRARYALGLPQIAVRLSPAVPRGEVWVVTDDDGVRVKLSTPTPEPTR